MTDRDMPDEPGLYELPQRYRTLQAEARELAASVADRAAVADEADRVDPVMRERLAASGLAAVTVRAADGRRVVRGASPPGPPVLAAPDPARPPPAPPLPPPGAPRLTSA